MASLETDSFLTSMTWGFFSSTLTAAYFFSGLASETYFFELETEAYFFKGFSGTTGFDYFLVSLAFGSSFFFGAGYSTGCSFLTSTTGCAFFDGFSCFLIGSSTEGCFYTPRLVTLCSDSTTGSFLTSFLDG
jgi:hypothetical protein